MTYGLQTKNHTDHLRGRIRGSQLAPETLSAGTAPGDAGAVSPVVVPLRARRPPRDGTARVGAVVPLDRDHRASLAKPLAALGWDRSTDLVAEVHGPRAVIREGKPTTRQPWLVPMKVCAGRLTLPPALTGALAVRGGEQVLAIALPTTGELQLLAAADVLQELTGERPKDAAPTRPVLDPGAQRHAAKSRVRASFGHVT